MGKEDIYGGPQFLGALNSMCMKMGFEITVIGQHNENKYTLLFFLAKKTINFLGNKIVNKKTKKVINFNSFYKFPQVRIGMSVLDLLHSLPFLLLVFSKVISTAR